MEVSNVFSIQSWSNEQVLQWFKGLDESLQKYESHFRNAGVVGRQLLNLSYDDLYNLRIHLVGHQELILDAVSLLQQLDYGLDLETLQSRALCLKCRCRGLRSSVATRRREAEEYEYDGGVSLQRGATNQLLHLAADVLNEGKQLILWLDRYPFNTKQTFQATRDKMVELCYELSVTMQQSVFACVIEDAALNICTEMENCAEGIVQLNDSLIIQPVSLENVCLRDVNPAEGLGLFIKATFEGHHVVTGTRNGSIAARARKITSGDEVIAVNRKAVVGWTLSSLVAILKEQPNEVLLLMKKRPQLSRSASTSNLLTTLQRSEKDRAKIFRVATPIRRIEDPTKFHSPGNNARSLSNSRLSSGTWSSLRSHDPADDVSSTSRTSGSDASDRLQSVATNDSKTSNRSQHSENYSTSSGKCSKYPRPLPHISVDATSPMDFWKFPPPPAEPYTPKTDHLTVQQVVSNSSSGRAASPNSILDIEHKRRYTVIGGSTVDERWYEEFLDQVNNIGCAASNKLQSEDKLSSNEEVFSQTPHKLPSSSTRNERIPLYCQSPRRSHRPVSMPPDYYSQVNLSSVPGGMSSRGRNRNYQPPFNNRSAINSCRRNLPTSNHSEISLPRHNRFNFNHNNSNNHMIGESPSRKTPPKPPPRSSSINKLSHRFSAEILSNVDHLRQSSLPEKSNLAVTVEGEKRLSSPLVKPAIPRKPTVSQVKNIMLGKAGRSKSTPHLQQNPEGKRNLSSQLSASDNILKEAKTRLGRKSGKGFFTSQPKQQSSSDDAKQAGPPRPIPKPRINMKSKLNAGKKQENLMPRERSNSHNDILDMGASPAIAERLRRKSAGYIPNKAKTATHVNEDEREGYSTPPLLRSAAPARSSPTRLSYTEAIRSESESSQYVDADGLHSNDVPQPNDHYEVRVIAGVPVRLRKSLTRLTGGKLKVSPDNKGKGSQSSAIGMKGEKRRVSCRDLGRGDCQGWLWKKKSGNDIAGNGPLTTKWAKRWVVIKERAIYCYRTNSPDTDQRAECYISLPGYTVTPASECKKKFAFRISHIKRKTFYFAAERQMDMSRWMNKMGLAAIEYKYVNQQGKGEEQKPNGDNDYYSESDEEASSISESFDVPSNSSSPSRDNSGLILDNKANGDVEARKLGRLYTTGHLMGAVPAERPPLTRSKSDSVGLADDQSMSSQSFTSTLPDNDVKIPEIVLPVEANVSEFHQNGDAKSNSQKLSRSLSSLTPSDRPSYSLAANYEKAKDRASRWASRLRRKSSSAERSNHMNDRSVSSNETSPSSSTSQLSSSKQNRLRPSRPLSTGGLHQSYSAPAIPSIADNSSVSAAPTEKHSPEEETIDSIDTKTETQSTSEDAKSEPSSPPVQRTEISRMRQSMKEAEVNLLGVNRNRTTLRRKMTVLNSDPRMNERMLRKRALERELKAKELELAYFDKLLNKDKISHSDLYSWINQHPSLVAEIGTIRRIAKHKRPPLVENLTVVSPPTVSEVSNSSDNRVGVNNNSNHNNNNSSPRERGRPRSSAIATADYDNPSNWDNSESKSLTLPAKPGSSKRRRKLHANRPLQSSKSNFDKPYLETDL